MAESETTAVVVGNRVSVPVPGGSLRPWGAVCQLLGHRLYWDPAQGKVYVDSVLDERTVVLDAAREAREVAWRVTPLLSQMGARVILVGEEDRFLFPAERARLARAAGADFFISLRAGRLSRRGSPAEGGVEVLYPLLTWRRSGQLARSLVTWLGRQTGLPGRARLVWRPWGEEGGGELLWRLGHMVAALVRLGGREAPEEEAGGDGSSFLDKCAQGVYWGLVEWLLDRPRPRQGVPAVRPFPPGAGENPPVFLGLGSPEKRPREGETGEQAVPVAAGGQPAVPVPLAAGGQPAVPVPVAAGGHGAPVPVVAGGSVVVPISSGGAAGTASGRPGVSPPVVATVQVPLGSGGFPAVAGGAVPGRVGGAAPGQVAVRQPFG